MRSEKIQVYQSPTRYWVNGGIKVKSRKVWVICLHVDIFWLVVSAQINRTRTAVIKMRECHFVFRTYRLSDDDLAYIIELVPVIIIVIHVFVQGLKLRTTRNGNIERFGRVERF